MRFLVPLSQRCSLFFPPGKECVFWLLLTKSYGVIFHHVFFPVNGKKNMETKKLSGSFSATTFRTTHSVNQICTKQEQIKGNLCLAEPNWTAEFFFTTTINLKEFLFCWEKFFDFTTTYMKCFKIQVKAEFLAHLYEPLFSAVFFSVFWKRLEMPKLTSGVALCKHTILSK